MKRSVRPSDVYPLAGELALAPPSTPAQAPRDDRTPAWLGVATLVVVGFAVAALGVDGGSGDSSAHVMDTASEDHAVAALAVYGAQVDAISALRGRRDVFAADGGPAAAHRAAEAGSDSVTTALQTLHERRGAGHLLGTYIADAQHARFAARMRGLAATARLIAVLDATHNSLYAGSASIDPRQAHQQLISEFADGPGRGIPAPLQWWSLALLAQLEDGQSGSEARRARLLTAELWAAAVAALEPPAEQALRSYVDAIPAATVTSLRSDPIAGPALRELDTRLRAVSDPSG